MPVTSPITAENPVTPILRALAGVFLAVRVSAERWKAVW